MKADDDDDDEDDDKKSRGKVRCEIETSGVEVSEF